MKQIFTTATDQLSMKKRGFTTTMDQLSAGIMVDYETFFTESVLQQKLLELIDSYQSGSMTRYGLIAFDSHNSNLETD